MDMNKEVRRIMTTSPTVVNPGHSLTEVSQIMAAKRLQQLPVVDGSKLVGLITVYDLWKENKKPEAERRTHVQEVMTDQVLTIAPKDKVGTAAELFIDRRFKTLPVVNLDNDLKGVVTAFDVIRYMFKEEVQNPILYKDVLDKL